MPKPLPDHIEHMSHITVTWIKEPDPVTIIRVWCHQYYVTATVAGILTIIQAAALWGRRPHSFQRDSN